METNRQLTRDAAVQFVSWQLSRRDWKVQYVALARPGASELHIERAGQGGTIRVQPRGLRSDKADVGLGSRDLEYLPSDWWVIVVNVREDRPTSYVLARAEVISGAIKDKDGQQWLPRKHFTREEYCEKWGRMGGDSC